MHPIAINPATINSVVTWIGVTDVFLNWLELVDLLERILKRNIIVLDVTDKTRLLCRPVILNPKKFGRPFIILLKKKK